MFQEFVSNITEKGTLWVASENLGGHSSMRKCSARAVGECMAPSCSSLDVGCGNNKRGSIGIDHVRGRSADVVADAHFLPFKDEVFDKIVSYTVLEHSPNPLNFLKEQYRVLRNDGEILVETDNAQYFAWAVLGPKVGGYNQADILSDHYMIFYPENVRRLLRSAGFSDFHYSFSTECTSRMKVLTEVLVKLGLLRNQCLFMRFKFIAKKQEKYPSLGTR